MNKNIFFTNILRILIITSIFGLNSCTIKPDTTSFNTQEELQFFGFAMVDCGFDDPNDSISKTNYIDEVSLFCNVAHMAIFHESENLSERLDLFHTNDVKAILSIENLLFEAIEDSSTGSGVRMILRSDYKSIWHNFVTLNSACLSPDYIAALYLIDEPVWNGVDSTDLMKAANTVDSYFQNIPILVIEAYPVIDELVIPVVVDWYGFDRYDTIDPSTDSDYLNDMRIIKSKQSSEEQHLVIIMDTQWRPYYQTDGSIIETDMSTIANNYFKLAQSESNVIAILGYLWPGGLDEADQMGARNLPQIVNDTYENIGKNITDK